MLLQTSSPAFRLACFVLIISFMTGFFISCQTLSKPLSIEEARKISLKFQGEAYTPPPRSADDLKKDLMVQVDDTICDPSPITPLTRQEVIEATAAGGCSGETWCKSQKLFRRGEFLMTIGHFQEAIRYIRMAIDEHSQFRTIYSNKIAECHANLGNFLKARMSLSSGSGFGANEARRSRGKMYYHSASSTVYRLQGNYPAAELEIRMAITASENAHKIHPGERIYALMHQRIQLGELLLLQGRGNEAENQIREVFFHPFSRQPLIKAHASLVLSRIYYEQGRYEDAMAVARASVAAYTAGEAHCSSLYLNHARLVIARSLVAMAKWDDALEEFDRIRRGMVTNEKMFHLRFWGDPDWAVAMIGAGRLDKAREILDFGIRKNREIYGDENYRTAEIRALRGVYHQAAHAYEDAVADYDAAVPVLLKGEAVAGADANQMTTRSRRRTFIFEQYISLLADIHSGAINIATSVQTGEESFRVADALRGRSLQEAVTALSTRIAAGSEELTDLIRREQDARKQINALQLVLYNALSQPEKDEAVISQIKSDIRDLTSASSTISAEIGNRFPEYEQMVRPKPASVESVRSYLAGNEALIAFYAGARRTFIWSLSATGDLRFFAVDGGREVLGKDVKAVRISLEPKTGSLADLPAFDIQRAFNLYQSYLLPVADIWQPARHLIVVPHGPIGHLPLALLPTAAAVPSVNDGLLLSEYREVPWLIREYSITVLPSADILGILRSLPAPPQDRKAFVGIGDPQFTIRPTLTTASRTGGYKRGAAPGDGGIPDIPTRAIRITDKAALDDGNLHSATLSMLQPLPDTREEVMAIAGALDADMEADVLLGADASEGNLKNMDLSDRKVLVFATHGLVPGDLDGLHEPALALTAPDVSGETGEDGLLTMGEIMGLRLNADWVVLSACNTAAGSDSDAEAVSGLGQSFFYAGSRALLVTNWPVESSSARLLTTDLFHRQVNDPDMSRAEALRQSMLNLLDAEAYRDPETGEELFSYAHPIFWAPFSLVGEGGNPAK